MYVKAQKELGAAKTSAFYSINPFIGALLGFLLLKEKLNLNYFIALFIMILGTLFIIKDTLLKHHIHEHTHKINYKIDNKIYTKEIIHSHAHNHYLNENIHEHKHIKKM